MSDQKRPYTKRKRAELEDETRRRITESAVALHGSLGPARTSISAIAEHAGVRRSTVYRHFPDEAALFGACSAHWARDHPPPDLSAWQAVTDPDERLRVALGELYAFYRGGEPMLTNVLRDAPLVPVVAELAGGFGEMLAAATTILFEGRRVRGAARRRVTAAIGHALGFPTWRSLALEQGLDDAAAADLMVRLVAAAGQRSTG
jgi:AcrR family transcriptional regulator